MLDLTENPKLVSIISLGFLHFFPLIYCSIVFFFIIIINRFISNINP
ncbi:hypothetical protein CXB51_022181 [Gossypium anomalum]|uniref:Uncharacterized protein n=1 Tax=Gossypium anomalum TaxID=47600 RepID=A0A8J5Y6X0_9ROSI|nr:hypothetical protein CXB51_022181 [Gossypium anomalum]